MKTGCPNEKKDQVKVFVPVCVAVVALTASGVTLARDVVIGGGASIGYEFEDRKYDDDDDDVPADQVQQQEEEDDTVTINRDERYSRLRLAPLVSLKSTSPRDEIKMRYSPSFWYDFETTEDRVDHDFRASLDRFLAPNWQVSLTERYLLTDEHLYSLDTTDRTAEPGETVTATDDTTTDTGVRLSDTDNRRRYWVNDLHLQSQYEYLKDSEFIIGYRYNILENINNDVSRRYEDYDRHEVASGLSYRFNPFWDISVFGSYARGLFEEAEPDPPFVEEEFFERDLKEYQAGTILQARLLEYQLYSLSYNYFGVEYDAEERTDAFIQDITLGWQWSISPNAVFGLGAGPSYLKVDGMDGEWEYNANLLFDYSFERGHLRFTGRRGYEILNFTGSDEDNGMREFWQSRLEMTYALTENLSAGLHAGYRYEDQDVNRVLAVTEQEAVADESDLVTEPETQTRERFSTGASLAYSFWKSYKVAVSYDFIRQDSELVDDSFDEHRAALTFSYETDLFKW